MWLKIIVVVLFIAILISLSGALRYLFKDTHTESKRTLYALGVRISLAVLLMAVVFYGLSTGQLGSTAPWDSGPRVLQTPPQN